LLRVVEQKRKRNSKRKENQELTIPKRIKPANASECGAQQQEIQSVSNMLYIISGKNGLGSSGPSSIAQLSMIRANGLEPPV
jgi:hypothetical protein